MAKQSELVLGSYLDTKVFELYIIFKSGEKLYKFECRFKNSLAPLCTGIAEDNSNLRSKPQKLMQRDNDVKIEKLTLWKTSHMFM